MSGMMMDMKNLGAGGQWRGSRVYYLGAEWFWKVSEKGETEKKSEMKWGLSYTDIRGRKFQERD